jgi:choline dehydrogenase-like flavoprotein
MTDLVVGSGPAGLAVAHARLAKGRAVVMLDGGDWLEPAAEARRDALAAAWDGQGFAAAALAGFRAAQAAGPPGAVRRHGSGFALADPALTLAAVPDWLGLRASRARGGLSNVWGAALLPWREEDIAGWPVAAGALVPHYRAVAGFLPAAGRTDGLADLLPGFPMAGRAPLAPGPQAEALLARLDRQAAALRRHGVHHGMARQAVAPGCRRCGLCLQGCPWGLIFSAASGLERLLENPAFRYLPGRVVRSFEATADGVRLRLEGGEAFAGTRLFLAAGVMETARIVLAALPEIGPGVTLRDSQHFFTPLLMLRGPRADPETAPHHTLAELFLELDAPEVSPFLVHSQLYGWNEAYAPEMVARYGRRLPFARPLVAALARRLARRLIVAQSFLHSAHSGRIALTRAPGDAQGRLVARFEANPETAVVIAAARARLARALRRAGLLALAPAGRAGAPGSSFHVGGSFPMRTAPRGAETDPAGRLAGLSRVHLADASVLPSIPATTITLPMMANAHRIGAEAP